MGDALWKDYYLPCGWGRRKKEIDQKTGWIHGRSPLKGILSEHPEQALMFIKNSFQTTALTWILSLGKKAIKDCEKTEKVRAIWRKLVFIQIAEREVFSHWQKPHCVLNKNHPVIFIEGAYDRFLLNGVETECFFNFGGRMPRSGGGLNRRKRRKQAYGRFLLLKQPGMQSPSIKILFDHYFNLIFFSKHI